MTGSFSAVGIDSLIHLPYYHGKLIPVRWTWATPQFPGRGFLYVAMRTIVFIDGQNLYHSAKEAWASTYQGPTSNPYSWPSYDVQKLAKALAERVVDRTLVQTRFYTGVPGSEQPFWQGFWSNKLRFLRSQGIYVYEGRISSRGQEKGVDVSIAIDLIRLTYERRFDVAVIVSQDSDFVPAVKLAKEVAQSQNRRVTVESAFIPRTENRALRRGIDTTDWVRIKKAMYDSCFDPTDYRPRS